MHISLSCVQRFNCVLHEAQSRPTNPPTPTLHNFSALPQLLLTRPRFVEPLQHHVVSRHSRAQTLHPMHAASRRLGHTMLAIAHSAAKLLGQSSHEHPCHRTSIANQCRDSSRAMGASSNPSERSRSDGNGYCSRCVIHSSLQGFAKSKHSIDM